MAHESKDDDWWINKPEAIEGTTEEERVDMMLNFESSDKKTLEFQWYLMTNDGDTPLDQVKPDPSRKAEEN